MKKILLLSVAVVVALVALAVVFFRIDSRQQIVREAYTYGYPLVTMDMTRRQQTNVRMPDDAYAPMGQLIKMRAYPAVDNKGAAAPNADTMYTMVCYDVSTEPWVFSIPDMGDRFYIMPMLSGNNEVFHVAGTRTTGTPEDYQAVHAQQDQYASVPLSAYGKPYTPAAGMVDEKFDMKKAVRKQVNDLPLDEFFSYFTQLLKANPPKLEDAPIVARMAKIGIVPGQDFDRSKLPVLGQKLDPKLALLEMVETMKAKQTVNGWLYWNTNAGSYGTDYEQRAMVTLIGPGLNFPQDAMYPFSQKDAEGKEYDGAAHKYVMRFEKGQMPPVKGFWSLTMYDPEFFFVRNPINRYNLSQRDKLVANPDGSVDLYLQAESPGPDKEANWLPAPKGKFIPMLRLYWPNETPPSILDGSWKPPALKRVP